MSKPPFKRFKMAMLLALVCSFVSASAQQKVYPPKEPEPPTVSPDFFIIPDVVIREQWPVALELVNAPADLRQIVPGQCIRFGVFAKGDGNDQFLKSLRFTFELTTEGKTQSFAGEPAHAVKRIKPTGGDFVTQALGVAGIKNPIESLASMAASRAGWCAPADLRDGSATISASATLPDGKSLPLNPRKLELKTFEMAGKQPAFMDMDTLGPWLQAYHWAPAPAQLLSGLRIAAADGQATSTYNIIAFFTAALKASPAAANDVLRKLPSQDKRTRLYAIPILRAAGYEVAPLMNGLDDADKDALDSFQIPDPFDVKPDALLPQKMDMLWATFFATGRVEPVRKIASMLAWREDYDNAVKLRDSGQKLQLTESTIRAAVYAGAGWSLHSLLLHDGLVADYVEAIKASPETPANVKAELDALATNPAFRRR
jgi:hypothetical protein